jgi:hypothetical protein
MKTPAAIFALFLSLWCQRIEAAPEDSANVVHDSDVATWITLDYLKGQTIKVHRAGSEIVTIAIDSTGFDSTYRFRSNGYTTPLHGVWSSFLSYEKSTSNSGPMTFLINQGVTVLNWNDSNFFRINYRGGYDFNSSYASGPIVSRLQNPSVFFEFDCNSNASWMAGWAHQSNGQFLTSDSDAIAFAKFNKDDQYPQSEAQDFASMGWDYYWTRYTRDFTAYSFSAEYKYHVRQMSEFSLSHPFIGSRKRIEDTSFFDQKEHLNIYDVDGLTLTLDRGFHNEDSFWHPFKFRLWFTTPELINRSSWKEFASVADWPKGLMAVYGGKVSFFTQVTHGRMSTLARFDDGDQFKFNFGVIVRTFANEGVDLNHLFSRKN